VAEERRDSKHDDDLLAEELRDKIEAMLWLKDKEL
jgi:hypothetical protein